MHTLHAYERHTQVYNHTSKYKIHNYKKMQPYTETAEKMHKQAGINIMYMLRSIASKSSNGTTAKQDISVFGIKKK